MPRATTKAELIYAANAGFDKLNAMIADFTAEQQSADFDYDAESLGKEEHWLRDRNLRDVLSHLHEWHRLLILWVTANLAGDAQPYGEREVGKFSSENFGRGDDANTACESKPRPFLPPPYTWKSYGEMNVGFWEKHQKTTLENATKLLTESHAETMKIIEKFTDEELFTKKHFDWTGTTNVGSYCVSATASHYDWAMKKLKAYKKNLGK